MSGLGTRGEQPRVNHVLVEQVDWDALKHALELGSVAGINVETGRAIVKVAEGEMDDRVEMACVV